MSDWPAPHFTKAEMACKCCGVWETVDHALLFRLERLRQLAGDRPLVVTSGYRCPKHNREVGGAEDSRHLHGDAADISLMGWGGPELHVLVQEAYRLFSGVGLKLPPQGTMLHVDTWRMRTWGYEK